MPVRAVLIDLDDTLLPDQAAADEAIAATAKLARTKHKVDPGALRVALRMHCRELWLTKPVTPKYQDFYVSSWEGLTSEFGDRPDESRRLKDWLPGYRRRAWTNALADFGVTDPDLVEKLVERLPGERAKRYTAYPGVKPVLRRLKSRYPLVVVTNGALKTQRRKLEYSGLAPYFSGVIISEPLATQKPDPTIYQAALRAAGEPAWACIMVGNSLRSDVGGAQGVGIRAIWLNRDDPVEDPFPRPDAIIASLSELPAAIERLG